MADSGLNVFGVSLSRLSSCRCLKSNIMFLFLYVMHVSRVIGGFRVGHEAVIRYILTRTDFYAEARM